MNMRQRFITPVVFSLLVGIAVGLISGGTAALAATSNVVIPIAGTVDGLPESVTLAGRVQVQSRMVTDPDFGTPPAVILSIDFLNVSGQGLSTGARYVAVGEQYLRRPLVPSDLVEITFPFYPLGARGAAPARPGLASFNMSFDVTTGALTGATGRVNTVNLP